MRGIVFSTVACVVFLCAGASTSSAQLVGHLEMVSPGPITYTQGVDFETFLDHPNTALGEATAPLHYVGGFGADPSNFAGFPAGAIALIERGQELFSTKVNNAADAGASGVLIYNNVPGPPALGSLAIPTTIPALNITQELGFTLTALLDNGGATMYMAVVPEPASAGLLIAALGGACLRRRR